MTVLDPVDLDAPSSGPERGTTAPVPVPEEREDYMRIITTLAVTGALGLATLVGSGIANADSGTDEFLAQMHGTNPGTTKITTVTVPGGDTELLSLAKVACAADAQGLVGRDVAAKVRAAEPQINFGQKDPKLIVDDPAIFLQNAALSYVCP
jgi:hypothetical protein